MTIALWCVLAAGLMPLLWTGVAKSTAPRFNNRDPRGWQAKLEGRAKRAHAAHLNSFEAFPLFAVGVLVAQQAAVPQATVDAVAIAFIALRLTYGICYLTDAHWLRSLVWFAALACSIGLFIAAA
ncbi:MAG: MAPEG family protein [Afipia sp.]|nr:MAPEG family protein [Afipia sp.]